jgi:nicotinamide mononucleotide (NMN) deamidase PncC
MVPDADTSCLIAAIHAAPPKCVLALTGGGASAAALLLAVPGASRTVLDVAVPYDERALTEYLGQRPEQFCSDTVSRALAERAFERAGRLDPGNPVIGVGCTASLATDRPKRGEHRCFLSVRTESQSVTHSLTFSKGARDRAGEEAVLDTVLLNALAEACGVPDRLAVPLLLGEEIVTGRVALADPVIDLLAGRADAVCQEVDGRLAVNGPRPKLLLSGSFNPLHTGHCRLAEVAAARFGVSPAFELAVVNPDKPALTAAETLRRMAQFTWQAPLWLTRAPTFTEKARLFPGTTFAVGFDTAVRIVTPHYYGRDPSVMVEALTRFGAAGCRFLVAGRVHKSGEFHRLEQVNLPAELCGLFEEIPESEFRLDVSSTQLRQACELGEPAA